ncbi:antibiotic biosynthesis monooxygenase [Zunongwangia sp. F363]|uniref:Antibiotic biosynthesis monooxygenase n=1 Tax=Autumnicola tepida TaxID=3075595 RepID=A0ABU3CES8_9FLAO|nr:antibiotic biosynthesis monooxygenase [Zunongwangia sp. F363]MDT0644855.1 antibiotic biosynthesis monooxygenase [Zunongwangia sp. F363]
MVKKGLIATIVARTGQADKVESFLTSAADLARKEEKTVDWFAFRIDEHTFGIFDTFSDEEGRDAHLNGEIAAKLMEFKDTLLSKEPNIQKIDILGARQQRMPEKPFM